MSFPFSSLGGLFLPNLAPQPQPGLTPPSSQLTLPGLPPQPGLPGAPSTLPPELLQLVNGSQSHAQQVLDLLGPPGSSVSRGDSVPPDAAGRAPSQSNQYASRHQAAEQRRRTRINERLDALRTLVPHAERANTACFLEEVIKYIIRLKDRNDQLEGAMDMLRACNKPGGGSSAAPRAEDGSAPQAPPAQPKIHQPQPRQHKRPSKSGLQQQQQQLQQQPDALPPTTKPMPPPNLLLAQQAPQQHLVGLSPELLSLQQQHHHHHQHGQVQQGQQPQPPPHQQQQQLHSQLLLLQLQQQHQQQLLQQQLQQASSQPLAGAVQGMQVSLPPFSNSLAGLPISLDFPPQQHHLAPPQLNHAHLPAMSVDMSQQQHHHHHHQQLQAQQLQLLLPPGVMLTTPPPHLGISPAELQHIQQLQHLQNLQQLQQQQLLHPQLSPLQPIVVGNGGTGVVLPATKPEQAGNASNEAGSTQDGAGTGGRDTGAATAGDARTVGGASAVGDKALLSQQQQPQQGFEGHQMAPVGGIGVGSAAGGEDKGAGGVKEAGGKTAAAASGSQSSPASSEESRGVPPKKRKMQAL